MMKRKLLVIMLAIVMVFTCAAGLAACGTKGDGGGGGNGTTYTVTFETVGGTAINPVEVKAGNTVARPADPTKTGAEFIDWFTTSTYEGEPYDFSTPVNSNLTLYAQWSDENYAVVFDVNGGSPVIDYATYLYGTELDEPDEPERVGYTFTGWYTDVKCTKKASFPYEVTGHSRFYAGWDSTREVTVNFKIAMLQGDTRDINYDEEILAPITITAGEELTQPENPKDISYLDKNGANHELKFSYWNFEPVYGNYSDAVLFPVRTTDVEEIMLYAVYVEVGEGDVYASLTVHPNNGEKETVMYGVQGEAIAISNLNEHDPAPFYSDKGLPRKPGYEATGYFKTSDFQSGTVYEIPFVLKNEQNDVYIRWEKKDDLTVTFDYNFDSIEDMTATFAYRGLIVRPENKMVTGYTFDGWYYTLYSAVEEQRWNFETDTASTDITLTAKWVKTATVITYDTCGGYERNPVAVSQGREITVLPLPVRQTGDTVYNFLGWYLDSEYTQEATLPMTIDNDITFYAKWSDAIDISLFEILDLGGSSGYSVRVRSNAKDEITGAVTLPARYGGDEIERIESSGFADCINITEVIVPDTVDYIYNNAFNGCTSLKKVVLPEGLLQLSYDVFTDCESLEEINFPGDSLYCVYADIFMDSPKMWEQLERDADGNYYWGTAFLGHTAYVTGDKVEDDTTTSVTVREGTTVVATYSFYYMNALETVTFADTVKYIPGYVFGSSSALKTSPIQTIHLPASYTEAGTLTTHFPVNVETITIPESNEEFTVIDGCLISVEDNRLIASTVNATAIPDGIVIIGENSFTNKPLDTVVIPNTVTTIRANAFADCEFTNINLPDSVGILDSTAFAGCSDMLSITFGAGINLQNTELFSDMSKLQSLSVNANNPYMYSKTDVLYRKATNTIMYFAPKHTGPIELADGLETLPADVFGIISGITERFVIPDSVTAIEDGAFDHMSIGSLYLGKNVPKFNAEMGSLILVSNVEVAADNPNMASVDGVLYGKDMTELLLFPAERTNYTIPDSVIKVEDYIYMPYLDDMTVGAGISRETFDFLLYGNEENGWEPAVTCGLNTVNVSTDNKELTLFEGVVYSKDKKELVYIPSGFDGDLILPKEMEVVDSYFTAHSSLWHASGEDADYNTIRIRTLRTEEGSMLREVSESAFLNIEDRSGGAASLPAWVDANYYDWERTQVLLYAVDLSNATKLESIDSYAFYALDMLTSVKLPETSFDLGLSAFADCENLESVSGLAQATVNNSFYNCPKLYDEDGLMIVDGVLFGFDISSANPDLHGDLIIPENVTKIAGGALRWVVLRSIRIPETVKLVCAGAIDPSADIIIYIEGENTEYEDGWYVDGGDCEIVIMRNGESESGVYYYVEPETGLYYRLDPNGTANLINDNSATEAWAGNVTLGNVTYGGREYILTEIGENAFGENSSDITGITLPETLIKIGGSTFDSIAAEEVIIPDSVKEIGAFLFYGNEAIKSVTLSSQITEIPDYMFYGCTALESVKCGNIISIADNAFKECINLKNFDFASVEAVGGYAFRDSGITQANFMKAKTIGDYAFSGCSALETLTLNEGLMSVGKQAFSGTGIKELSVPASLTEVGDYAFYGNNTLEKVTFAGSVYGKGAFQQNPALRNVTFTGGKAYEVGEQAFWQCTALSSVTFGSGLTSIGAYAFRETAVTSVSFPETLKTIGDYAFYKCAAAVPIEGGESYETPTLTSVTFAEGIESIGDYAFYIAALTEVNFPASLKSIGAYAFYYNHTLVSAEDGTDVKTSTLKFINFNEGLESIGTYAFYASAVETLHMPASLTEYGDLAFLGCSSLKEISFADGSTNIGGKDVFQCKALEKVTFGSSNGLVIAARTFYGASALKEIVFDENCTVKEIGDYAFGNTALTEFTLPEVEVMGRQVFYHCTGLTLTVPYTEDALPEGWSANWNTTADAKVVYAG